MALFLRRAYGSARLSSAIFGLIRHERIVAGLITATPHQVTAAKAGVQLSLAQACGVSQRAGTHFSPLSQICRDSERVGLSTEQPLRLMSDLLLTH